MNRKRYVDGERFHAEDYNECLDAIEQLENEVPKKQDKLSVGHGIDITNNVISSVVEASDFDIKDLSDSTGLKNEWSNKQDALVAGDGISISGNTISATNAGEWGTITGDITDQTDLVDYVDEKINQIVTPEPDKEVISVLTYSNTTPSDAQENDYYINSSVSKLYKYVNNAWEEQEAKNDCLYITEDTQTVYSYSTSTGVFTDVTGEPIDNVITITNLNQLDKYKEDAVYTVMYYDEDDDLYVYSFVVDRERIGPPSSPFYEVTQKLHNQYEYKWRIGETELFVTPVVFTWEDWRTYRYAFLPESFTPGHLTSFGASWDMKLRDSGKSISDLATKAELNNKQDVLSAGTNVIIDSANTISVDGYVFEPVKGNFAEKYRQDAGDGGQLLTNSIANTAFGSHAEGYGTTITGEGYGAHAEGQWTAVSGYAAHAEGDSTQANGDFSHAEGGYAQANGAGAHAEGGYTLASGQAAHAEGYNTIARKTGTGTTQQSWAAHAEGWSTIAEADGAHAEGYMTTASGMGSHAEGGGNNTLNTRNVATGQYSHVEGHVTTANNVAEHAEGIGNISHGNSSGTIVGGGSNTLSSIGCMNINSGSKRNAREIMQNGDYYLLGVGNYDGVHIKGESGAPSGLQTLQEVINGMQPTVYSAGDNITITSANTINANGYVYDSTNNSFKEGIYTQVTNDSEHAEGKYNKSNSLGGGSDDYVDLGLPSGTLWCSHNIGATNENTIDSWRGDFYRCCDIVPFSGRTTKQEYNEYISGKTEEYENPQGNTFFRIKPEYDPATLLMGEEWRLPSNVDIDELCDAENTTIEHVTNYSGVTDLNGILFTSVHNGNTLFLPFGEQNGDVSEIYTEQADYWASNTDYQDTETTTGSLFLDLTYIHGEEPIGNAYFQDVPTNYYGGLYRAVKVDSNTSSGETKNTRHSIGIGTSDSNRMNAVEVMDNGDTYIYGIGGYDGTNPGVASTLQETIDEKQTILVPGDNITITSANTINADGYLYDHTKGSFLTVPVNDGATVYTNTCTGLNALCTGQNNTVTGEASAVIGGQGINVTGAVSVGIGGYNNIISADYSAICAGQANTISSGANNSFIAGRNNTVSGFASATIGRYNDATNNYCVVIGSGSQSMHNIASGDSAINIGRYNSVEGNGSVAVGGGLQIKNVDEVGLGVWNVSHSGSTNSDNTSLSIGVGANNSRKNSLEIMKNGDTYLNGVGNYSGTTIAAPGNNIQTLQTVINGKQDVFTTGKGLNMSNNNLITYDVVANSVLAKSGKVPFNNGSRRTISWNITDIELSALTIVFSRLGPNYVAQIGGTEEDPIYELRAFTDATWMARNDLDVVVTIQFDVFYKNTTGVATPITLNPNEYVIIQASYYWDWDLSKGSYTDKGYWIITNIKTFS